MLKKIPIMLHFMTTRTTATVVYTTNQGVPSHVYDVFVPIIPALCFMLLRTDYPENYAGIIDTLVAVVTRTT